jgi:hypothetical protein
MLVAAHVLCRHALTYAHVVLWNGQFLLGLERQFYRVLLSHFFLHLLTIIHTARPFPYNMPSPAPFKPVQTQLLISDFDESFSDADTDRWVFEVLSPVLRRKFEEIALSNTMQFTDMCASLLSDLHKEGKTPEDIVGAQRKVYVHPAMIRGVKELKSASSPKTECFLLSNSNEVYLKTVLEVSIIECVPIE